MATKEHMTPQNHDARLVRLETNYEQLVRGQSSLETEVHNLGDRIDRGLNRIADDISTRSRPQWSLLIMAGSFIVTIFSLVAAAAYAFNNQMHVRVMDTISARFSQVETKFEGVHTEIQTQISNNQANVKRNDDEILRLRDRQEKAAEQIARDSQRLIDHDTYLWPLVLDRTLKHSQP